MAVLEPPVELASARPVQDVPVSRPGRELAFEPKWDGWRAAPFSALGVLQSRRANNLAARFPEIMTAAAGLGDVVLDGEIVAMREGRIEFGALAMSPQSRTAAGAAVSFVAFDLLAEGWRDRRPDPWRLRRAALERLFAEVAPPLLLTPSTTERDAALAWMIPEFAAAGIEGCVAKQLNSPHPGRSGAWVKVRQLAVVDAVVVGVVGPEQRPSEVVLARRDDAGEPVELGCHRGECGQIGQRPPRGRGQLELADGPAGAGEGGGIEVGPATTFAQVGGAARFMSEVGQPLGALGADRAVPGERAGADDLPKPAAHVQQ